MKKYTLFVFSSLFSIAFVVSQSEVSDSIQTNNFFHIQKIKNEFYKENPGARGEKQWRRQEWFLEPRLYPSGEMKNIAMHNLKALKKYQKTHPDQRSTHGGWFPLGPSDWIQEANNNGLGRINCIEIHPTNDQIIYAGGASGGVWKTLNGGTTWTNVSPYIPNLFVTDIEIDHINPNVIYLLTGDADVISSEPASHHQLGSPSIGILKSSDAGNTWHTTGFSFLKSDFFWSNKLLMHPVNPAIQYVASYNGIYKTEDGWQTYEHVYGSIVFDIEFKPTSPNIMYASRQNEIIRSLQSGDIGSWFPMQDQDFIIYSGTHRIEIAVTPDNPEVIYAIGGTFGSYDGVMYSESSGDDDTWVVKDLFQTNFFGQATYTMAIVIDPNNYQRVFAGMVGINRSFNEGLAGSWNQLNGLHPDYHDLVYKNGILYAAHDGGIVKSTDEGTSWTYISHGIQNTQIYRISGTPQNSNFNVIGTQDCGFMMKTNTSSTYTNIGNGDGMVNIIDPTNSDILYIVGQYGGGLKFDGYDIIPGVNPVPMYAPGANGEWVTPLIMDPVFPNVLFIGRDGIYRTDMGAAENSWKYLGDPADTLYNCMAQGTNNRHRLYVSEGPKIWRTSNALTNSGVATWESIKQGLPNLFISDIVVNPLDANEVFVSFAGFGEGLKVYKSTNGGAAGAWTNISGTLPNVSVNCMIQNNNAGIDDALYIGTDLGVFYYDATLGDWVHFNNHLPAVTVTDLIIHSNGLLLAGTWGRGLWASGLYSGCDASINLSNSLTFGGVLSYSAANDITSAAKYRFDVGTEINYKAGTEIEFTEGFEIGGEASLEAKIGPCPGFDTQPLIDNSSNQSNFIMTRDQTKNLLHMN